MASSIKETPHPGFRNYPPIDDKEYLIEIIKKQFIETKREAIAKRSKEAISNLKKGTIKKGTVKELYRDLESD